MFRGQEVEVFIIIKSKFKIPRPAGTYVQRCRICRNLFHTLYTLLYGVVTFKKCYFKSTCTRRNDFCINFNIEITTYRTTGFIDDAPFLFFESGATCMGISKLLFA